MAESPAPSGDRNHTIEYIATLIALLAVTITCGAMGYRDAMNTALGAFIGYGMSSRPGAQTSGPVVGISTVGLAIAANVIGHLAGA